MAKSLIIMIGPKTVLAGRFYVKHLRLKKINREDENERTEMIKSIFPKLMKTRQDTLSRQLDYLRHVLIEFILLIWFIFLIKRDSNMYTDCAMVNHVIN